MKIAIRLYDYGEDKQAVRSQMAVNGLGFWQSYDCVGHTMDVFSNEPFDAMFGKKIGDVWCAGKTLEINGLKIAIFPDRDIDRKKAKNRGLQHTVKVTDTHTYSWLVATNKPIPEDVAQEFFSMYENGSVFEFDRLKKEGGI